MNIREIIESGTIELYVMNALPVEEAARIKELALQYPEIQAEITALESALEQFGQAHSVTPRPELKAQILAKIASETSPTENPQPTPKPIQSSPNIPTTPPLSILRFLPWILAAGLAGSTFFFFQKNEANNKAKEDCSKTQKLNEVKSKKIIADLEFKLDVLKSPGTRAIALNGLKISPDSKVTVYWNSDGPNTFVNIQDLPEPPANKQYQLWAIVNKKPVSAGVFEYSLNTLQPMKGFYTAEAFAITLEPVGGSESPTVEQMYVLGTL